MSCFCGGLCVSLLQCRRRRTRTKCNSVIRMRKLFSMWRAKDGRFEIDSSYFMPVIRDLPVFPDKMLKTGDEWTAEGYEAEDLRRQLNVEEPFFVPFTAKYKYERDEEGFSSDSSRTKKIFAVISAKYTLFYETEMEQTKNGFTADFPVTTMGFSDRTIWWDFEKGQIDHYEENFIFR